MPAAAAASPKPVETFAEKLQGIVIVPRKEDVNQTGVTGVRGIVIKGPRFLRRNDFVAVLRRYLGSPLTDDSRPRPTGREVRPMYRKVFRTTIVLAYMTAMARPDSPGKEAD